MAGNDEDFSSLDATMINKNDITLIAPPLSNTTSNPRWEEQNGLDLKELEKLNLLRETIHIKGLGKVIDPTNVATRILKDKKYLEEIDMTFDVERIYGGSIAESNASVLKALQPNSNLEMLTIREYRGNNFSNWVSGCHLPNLVYLRVEDCGLCSHMPPLGQIPSLKKLHISGYHTIKIIGKEFSNNNFNYLESLRFERMKNWEEWLCIEAFPLLKEIYIHECPKLKRISLPKHLHSL
ncbi:putative disease resistance RPP13-like protein 1 [Vicia villosa]|uniref:putative disease resistance RPP13-like protein 1 n=1 Tax=Vicia villosa TaxID=3911 RepID=UPI00273C34C0|nr:putative disease resistance RPP13-like protein 1 [Vicia villosa]